jgi:hypothetical protein
MSVPHGSLIVNADDWGRDSDTTTRIFECAGPGGVSAVSAMVFMADSERAAALARAHGIEAGLHLNFTTPFTAPAVPARLVRCQQKIARFLRCHRLATAVFNPALAHAFAYAVGAQRDEFRRLYGADPVHVDGHHHMHLCANVLCGRLLPSGALVRRSFSFAPDEKSAMNRFYRAGVDRILARRHRLTDYFFSLAPLAPAVRVRRICALASRFTVELETHPVQPDEYRFLRDAEILRQGTPVRIVAPSSLRLEAATVHATAS